MNETNENPSMILIPSKKSTKGDWIEYAMIRERQVEKQSRKIAELVDQIEAQKAQIAALAGVEEELRIARSKADEFEHKFLEAGNRIGLLTGEIDALKDQILELELDDAEELARLERDEERDRIAPEIGAAPPAPVILVSQERTCPWDQHEDQPRTWMIAGRVHCPRCGLPKE